MDKCELCLKNKATENHHYIPKTVIKKIKPNSNFNNKTLRLCHSCHQAIHNSFIEHAVQQSNVKGEFNRYDAVKWLIVKQFLKKTKKKAYKEWANYWKGFIEESFKEIESG